MTVVPAERRSNLAPAMLAAAGLHLLVILGALLVFPDNKSMAIGGATTVTIVDAPPAELRNAIQADEVAQAQSEQPSPEAAPVETPSPEPTPAPQPQPAPAPRPTPAPAAKAAPAPKPAPAPKAKGKTAESSDDLLSRLMGPTKPQPAGGARGGQQGRPRPATNTVQTTGSGSADAALGDASAAVGERLRKAWIIDCSLEGMSRVTVKVRFGLNRDGSLRGEPVVLNPGSGPAAQAAADRALIAVARAAPFSELPKDSYAQWKDFTANFLGSQACR